MWRECTVASENGSVRQSAQSLRSSSGYDSRITRRSSSPRETCSIRSDGTRNSYPTSCCISTIQWRATGKSLARLRAKIWKTTRRPETIQIMLRSRFEFGRSWTIILCSSIIERIEDPIFMPRICTTSRRRRGKLCTSVDQKQRTIRPCLGGKGLQKMEEKRWS